MQGCNDARDEKYTIMTMYMKFIVVSCKCFK